MFRPSHLLFAALPLSVISSRLFGPGPVTFCLALAALLPVAVVMGEATEQLAIHRGPLVGGLLNATFGNAAELVVGYLGLSSSANLAPMVKASIVGSIIGNLLLVLGMGAAAGGIRHKEQRFGVQTGSLMSTLMLLAVIGLVVPAVFVSGSGQHRLAPAQVQSLSVSVAAILLATYLLGLIFSLVTHQSQFAQDAMESLISPSWSVRRALAALLLCAVLVYIAGGLVVDSVQATSGKLGVSQTFIGVTIIAIVGNAAEHASAVWMAYKGRMDICFNVVVSSSSQVALFVAPVLVLVSLWLPHRLDFIFSSSELVAVILSVAVAHFVALDGKTNWFEGVELLAVYLILGVAFFYLPTP